MVELDIVNGGTPGSGADQPTRSLDSRGPDAVHELGERSSNNTNLKCEVLLSRMFPDAVDRPSLGRYDVLEFVGEGGMGTVYSAYDPRLDRKVAVKLVRNASSQPRRRTRLVREAKALARLSHSNVVTVHEVWDEGGELYIAMEFVEGHNLAQWQREPRSLREILDVYLQAGEGLAAVHDAGLVYRDFKPANVIRREDDGVVKLLDFGLARVDTHASTHPSMNAAGFAPSMTSSQRSGPTSDVLTHPGSIVGTPAYMAPEQLEGLPADARSDQFSFAISLWEALYGQRPFARSSSLEVAELEPRIEPPSDHSVPAWIHRVMDRALAPDPFDRYPSMRALLEDLRRDPAVRRRRIVSAVAMVTATVVGGLVVAELRAEPPTPCVEVRTAWDEEQRREAKEGVLQVGSEETWNLLAPRLDHHASELSAVRKQACESHRRGLLPDQHYALQVACLDRRGAGFSGLVDLLERADVSAVANANKAVMQLSSPASCADIDVLLADSPVPEDPAIATRVDELRQELARASTEESAGLYDEAAERAGAVLREAELLSYRPLRAEALVRRGSARMQLRQPEATADLDASLWLSLQTEQRRVAAEAAAKRIFVYVDPERADRDVAEAISLARSLFGRSGAADWQLRWVLSNNIGAAHYQGGEAREALAAYEEALQQLPESYDRGRFERAVTLMNMASAQQTLGRSDVAIQSNRRAIEEIDAVFGPGHPQALGIRTSLARLHRVAGHFAEARAILEDVLDPAATSGSASLNAVFEAAEAARLLGDLDGATAWIERAQAMPDLPTMWREAFAVQAAEVAAANGDATAFDQLTASGLDVGARRRADVLMALGRAEEAEAILTPLVDEPDQAVRYPERALLQLGRALVAQQRWTEAERRLTALVEAQSFNVALGAWERSRALQGLAAAHAGQGRLDRASGLAEEALQILTGFDRDSVPVREALAVQAKLRSGASSPR